MQKYSQMPVVVLACLFLSNCVPKGAQPAEEPLRTESDCHKLDEQRCKSISLPNSSCAWLKSDLDKQFACRTIRSRCVDVTVLSDCLATGISSLGQVCAIINGRCELKTGANGEQEGEKPPFVRDHCDGFKDKNPCNSGKDANNNLCEWRENQCVIAGMPPHALPRDLCSDYLTTDSCNDSFDAQGKRCAWDNLIESCVVKITLETLTLTTCEEYLGKEICNVSHDRDQNNCLWDEIAGLCKAIRVIPAPSHEHILCSFFQSQEVCDEAKDWESKPCIWNDRQSRCFRWNPPSVIRPQASCGFYRRANVCNLGLDRNNVSCIWNKDQRRCIPSSTPPIPARRQCNAFRDEALCNRSTDGHGNRCVFSATDNTCKTAAAIALEEQAERPFLYKTLKDWTDVALTWNEAFVDGARRNYDAKIPLEEFDLAIQTFAQHAVSSNLKEANKWLGGTLPTNAEFFDISKLSVPSLSAYVDEDFYGEKKSIPAGGRIVVIGDFHGSLHSLLRNLWRLYAFGYLDNDFKIVADNTHLVFTGDFVDRGRYSAETLYTLLRLKLSNFDKVHLVRGNHENAETAYSYGFYDELKEKYGNDNGPRVFDDTMATLRFLPVVFFSTVGDRALGNTLHFSHGGFGYNFESGSFVHSPKDLLDANDAILYELIPKEKHWGYAWSDFEQQDEATRNTRGFNSTAGAVTAGLSTLANYLTNNRIRAIFRGHQDMEFGLKMLFKTEPTFEQRNEAKSNTIRYKDGPFHWIDVVLDRNLIENAAIAGIGLLEYAPVYTFTTASEGRQMLYDAFGIIKTADDWQDFRLEVHEIRLPNLLGQYVFVNVSNAEANDDGIRAEWSLEGPGRCYINP